MNRKKLFWQLYPSYLWIALFALAIIVVFACASFRSFFYDQTVSDLEARAQLISREVYEYIEQGRVSEVDELVKDLGKRANTHITIFLWNGRIIGDTDTDDLNSIASQATRPEVQAALQGKQVMMIAEHPSIKKELIHVAVPVQDKIGNRLVVRVSIPVTFIQNALWTIYLEVMFGGLLLVIFVAVVSWFYSRKIAHPLEVMREQAEAIAKGDFSSMPRLASPSVLEIESLARAINEMAEQLSSRMSVITDQKNEQLAVLSSMIEGVVAVDRNKRIINMNRAAAEMLDVEDSWAEGKLVEEVIRIPELQRFIYKMLSVGTAIEEELTVAREHGDRHWQLHGTALRSSTGDSDIGGLLVLNDISRMRKLEAHRRDFVANVSHELRTPLTSIKGFLETLLDGAVEDTENARHFLTIAQKHADRLNAIIEDLLKLSRLEKEVEESEIPLESGVLRKVLEEAIQMCQNKANKKNIQIELDCNSKLHALMNAPLLEQAVVNLIDNAIKYSDEGKTIRVLGSQKENEVIVSVIDQGHGIEEKHLKRLFERFYRVDKARSRAIGGTGLGLSIVKHVVLAHRGATEVSSEVGVGSTFSLRLQSA